MARELKVLRVLNSREGLVKLGSKEYSVTKDRKALLEDLGAGCFVASPTVAVSKEKDVALFHWLMNNSVDMSKVFAMPTRGECGLVRATRVVSKHIEDKCPDVSQLDKENLMFAKFTTKVLSGFYKLYHGQELKTYNTILPDVLAKKDSLVAEFNLLAGTNVERLSSYTVKGLGVSDTELLAELSLLLKKYRKLEKYTKLGPTCAFNSISSRLLSVWATPVKISSIVSGATDCSINPKKYYTVALSGLFCEVRYFTGQTSTEYLRDTLGIDGVDASLGVPELRKQGIDVNELVRKYYRDMHRYVDKGLMKSYNKVLVSFILDVLDKVESEGYKAYIDGIGGAVQFVFSNSAPVSVTSSALSEALKRHPELCKLLDTVYVGDRPAVPVDCLFGSKCWNTVKSRDAAHDFYRGLTNRS